MGAAPWAARPTYTRIPLGSLDDRATVGCDLYQLVPPDRYVLYVSGDCPLADGLRAELARRQITDLYIDASDGAAYSSYLISRVERASLSDASVEAQAGAAYEATHFLVERVFQEPRSEAIADLHRVVAKTVDMALDRPDLARSLMHLTRHDAYSYSHSVNVAVFGTALALAVGTDATWVRRMAQGLSVHDIGKARVPLEVLNFPGRLDAEQWAQMRRHPELGVEILGETGFLEDPIVHSIVYRHHERSDGSGYPEGLGGDQIPFEARVCTICDVFDALTTQRPYRKPSRTFEGIQIMITEMRQEFDPELFAAFIRLFERMN